MPMTVSYLKDEKKLSFLTAWDGQKYESSVYKLDKQVCHNILTVINIICLDMNVSAFKNKYIGFKNPVKVNEKIPIFPQGFLN